MDQMKSAEAKWFLEFIITHRIKEACEAIDQEEETGDLDKDFVEYVKLHEKKLKLLRFGNAISNQLYNAFMFPAIDMSLEPFSWGSVKLSDLQLFCNSHPSVDYERLHKVVDPILRSQCREVQLKWNWGMGVTCRITDLLTYESHSYVRKEKSKRLLAAIKRLTSSCACLFNKEGKSTASLPLPSPKSACSS